MVVLDNFKIMNLSDLSYITDKNGKKISVIIPIELFEQLVEKKFFNDSFVIEQEQQTQKKAQIELKDLLDQYDKEFEIQSVNSNVNNIRNIESKNYEQSNDHIRKNDDDKVKDDNLSKTNHDAKNGISVTQDFNVPIVLLNKKLFYKNGKAKAEALLIKVNNKIGIRILKGSTAIVRQATSMRKSAIKLRDNLLESGILVKKDSNYVFVEDYDVKTCSLAASLIAGNNRGIIDTWCDEDGKNLQDLGFF